MLGVSPNDDLECQVHSRDLDMWVLPVNPGIFELGRAVRAFDLDSAVV